MIADHITNYCEGGAAVTANTEARESGGRRAAANARGRRPSRGPPRLERTVRNKCFGSFKSLVTDFSSERHTELPLLNEDTENAEGEI